MIVAEGSARVELAIAPDQPVGEAYRSMTRAFKIAGIDTAALDARLLLCVILEIDAAVLIAQPDRPVGDKAAMVVAAASRRIAREPISRIVGYREFYGRDFQISPATLDPRPDTETLVDAILNVARSPEYAAKPLRLIDVGTGSGCLLVTLLAELPIATGVATDISQAALEIAARNASTHGVSSRMEVRIADALDGIDETFDMLVSNPPYIPSLEICTLQPEVRDFEPMDALDGGPDGLAIYRRIIGRLNIVVPVGYAFFEIGKTQAGEVSTLLRIAGRDARWPLATVTNDMAGHPRCVAQKTLR